MITFVIPIRTISEANRREHWAAKACRVKSQREAAYLCTLQHRGKFPDKKTGRIRIILTRIGARRLDSDNLAAACKAARDGIADALGIDDGSARLIWCYEQRVGKPPAVIAHIAREGER